MKRDLIAPPLIEIQKQFYATNLWRGCLEMGISLLVYGITLFAIYACYQLDLLLLSVFFALLHGLSIARLFIVQHDCSHYNLFPNKKWNIWVGRFLSLFTLTPYYAWAWQHHIHHGASGNLDKRGIGDIEILTVDEYAKLSYIEKKIYRLKRNMCIFLFLLAPIYFLIILRAPHIFFKEYKSHKLYSQAISKSAYLTNVHLILFYALYFYLFGTSFMLTIYLLSFCIASAYLSLGFYGQHHFKETYFVSESNWNYLDAALKGSSFYKLPLWLEWYIYNINFHSAHHLYPRVPGYNLKKCYLNYDIFKNTPTYSLKDIRKLFQVKLYDTKKNCAISWQEYNSL